MGVKISGDLKLEELVQQVKKLDGLTVEIYVEGEEMNIIANTHEFGATISKDPLKAKRAKMFVAMKMKEKGIEIKPNNSNVIEIPERSFFRSSFDDPEVLNKVAETVLFYLHRYLDRKNTAKEVIERGGYVLLNAIQSRIASNMSPKKHPLSIAESGNSNTLQGKTGRLIKSIRLRFV
jgi:hypothetical protein